MARWRSRSAASSTSAGASASAGQRRDGDARQHACRPRSAPPSARCTTTPVAELDRSVTAAPEAELGAVGDRGVGHRLADLAEPAPRVQVVGAALALAGGQRLLARPTGRCGPTPGGRPARWRARRGAGVPQLAQVRRVEGAGDGRPEARLDHRAGVVALRPRAAARAAVSRPMRRRAAAWAGGLHQVAEAEREAEPAAASEMRPRRGRRWRSSPSSSLELGLERGGSSTRWRRWLPKSTRMPAISKLPAMPPTAGARSSTMTERPAGRASRAAMSPAGPAPSTTTSNRSVTRSTLPAVVAAGSP